MFAFVRIETNFMYDIVVYKSDINNITITNIVTNIYIIIMSIIESHITYS